MGRGDAETRRRGDSNNNRRSGDLEKLEFGPLPGTEAEAEAIAPILPGVTLLTESKATENALKQLQGPEILHIASHGFFLEDVELVAPADFGFTSLSSDMAESQLISLWKVDDFGTKELMVKYYQRVLNKEGRSEAIRQTQLEMLASPQYQHPFYWASFIPSGEWKPME
ncbi:MAG: CHAT domain-containing protein [Coleofasciculaceae cyanobacterium]